MTAFVEVSETALLAVGGPAAGWWFEYRIRNEARCTVVGADLTGDTVRVECRDVAEAELLEKVFHDFGMAKRATKVVRA